MHPTSVVHALVRFRDGASLAHLGYPDMRVPISFALTLSRAARDAGAGASTSRPASRSSSSRPIPSASRCCALAREAGERGGTYPCAFNAANEVAVAAFLDGRIRFLDIARLVEDRARARSTERPRAISRELVEADEEARRLAEGRLATSLSIFIAILGLAFLILVHEAGHFFASLAVGLRPRRFYVGFPPAIAKTTRNGIEYGIGAIPLGGFVTIPGMHRPIPHDAERRFSRAVEEAPDARRGRRPRASARSTATTSTWPSHAVDDLEEALEPRDVTPAARALGGEGHHRAARRARPGCVLEGADLEAPRRDRRGPRGQHRSSTIVLFTFLFMTVAGRRRGRSRRSTPELEVRASAVAAPQVDRTAGRRPDRRDQRSAGEGRRDRRHDRATPDGRKLTLTVAPRRGGGQARPDRATARRRPLPARLRPRGDRARPLRRRSVAPSR